MPEILSTKSLYYNDVSLVSRLPGEIESRKNVPLEKERIISAPMTSLVGKEFIIEAAKNGISVTIPRFLTKEQKVELYNLFYEKKNSKQLCFIGIGLNEDLGDLIYIKSKIPPAQSNWLIDIAFAGIPQLDKNILDFSSLFPNPYYTFNLMIGNIMSGNELRRVSKFQYNNCEQLFIRVGISGGIACSTSDVTGFGRGQITEQIECFNVKKEATTSRSVINQVADGGIKNSGYASKAFAAGSDYIMLGSYFSNALEAETNIKGNHEYWGLASEKQIKDSKLNKSHSEGKINKIDKTKLKPLKELIDELWGGICSAVSYSGYRSLSEFIGNGVFEIKQNSLPPKTRF